MRSGEIFVHFGMPKTGSSSIQVYLFQHLSDPRFHYVKLGGPNSSNAIATGFKANAARFHFHARSGTSTDELRRQRERVLAKLDAELQSAGTATPILSGEAVSGLKESEFRDLCNALSKRRQSVLAVGYVRRPKEYMESTLQERVKSGDPDFDISRLFPNYRRRFDRLDAVLGRDNVRIWPFDLASFPGKCVVQDFCSRLGIRFRAEDVTRANDGLSLPALSLLFAYRKFGPGYGVGPNVIEENQRLIRHVRSLSGPKLRLHSSLVAPVLEKRREQIEWMEARLGAPLSENLTEHDDVAIRSERDLLKFPPDTLQWLARELGKEYAGRWRPGMSPRKVAEWVHLLRFKLSGRSDGGFRKTAVVPAAGISIPGPGQGDVHMTINDLIQSARQSAKLGSLTDEDAQHLLREVFSQIRQVINATPEGKIEVDGLGLFRIRQGEREKDGQTVPVKRVAFRADAGKPAR